MWIGSVKCWPFWRRNSRLWASFRLASQIRRWKMCFWSECLLGFEFWFRVKILQDLNGLCFVFVFDDRCDARFEQVIENVDQVDNSTHSTATLSDGRICPHIILNEQSWIFSFFFITLERLPDRSNCMQLQQFVAIFYKKFIYIKRKWPYWLLLVWHTASVSKSITFA